MAGSEGRYPRTRPSPNTQGIGGGGVREGVRGRCPLAPSPTFPSIKPSAGPRKYRQ